jgi:biotin carboxyl carrier protein
MLSYSGQTYRFSPVEGRKSGSQSAKASGLLRAPMVGVVAEILVMEGQEVMAYQPLAVLEAMKVMTTLEAPFAGTVRKIYAQQAQRVEHDAPIIEVAEGVPVLREENG